MPPRRDWPESGCEGAGRYGPWHGAAKPSYFTDWPESGCEGAGLEKHHPSPFCCFSVSLKKKTNEKAKTQSVLPENGLSATQGRAGPALSTGRSECTESCTSSKHRHFASHRTKKRQWWPLPPPHQKSLLSLENLWSSVADARFSKFPFLLESSNVVTGNKYCPGCFGDSVGNVSILKKLPAKCHVWMTVAYYLFLK